MVPIWNPLPILQMSLPSLMVTVAPTESLTILDVAHLEVEGVGGG